MNQQIQVVDGSDYHVQGRETLVLRAQVVGVLAELSAHPRVRQVERDYARARLHEGYDVRVVKVVECPVEAQAFDDNGNVLPDTVNERHEYIEAPRRLTDFDLLCPPSDGDDASFAVTSDGFPVFFFVVDDNTEKPPISSPGALPSPNNASPSTDETPFEDLF